MSAQTKGGWTALHLASLYDNVDVARVLMEHGADVSAQTEHGWTALHLAPKNGHTGLARMLTEHSTKIETLGSPGPTYYNHNSTC